MNDLQQQMMALIRSGLWGIEVDRHAFEGKKVSWKDIFYLAMDQAMVGVVGDGLEFLPKDFQPSQKVWMHFVMMATKIENQNERMNRLIGKLVRKDNRWMLLKGQEVAQCYRNPLRRMSGDIDMLMGFEKTDYDRGKAMLELMTMLTGTPNDKRRHADYVVDDMLVEVHGNMKFRVSRACDRLFVDWMKERLQKEGCRIVEIDGEQVKVLPEELDVLFVFVHMLNHLMQGGVGLRQVTDWMMVLHANRERIETDQLINDIYELHLEKFWLPLAALAVEEMGFPKEEMPLYDSRYGRKGRKILDHIFLTGNFGAKQKEQQIDDSHGKWLKKLVTFWGQLPVYWHNFWLYPKDTVYCFRYFVRSSMKL